MKQRKTGQKISFFFSILCYVMAVVAVVFAIVWKLDNGTQDPIFASALASIFFFASCGFVLQFIANADLPDFNLKP